jgi:hypothetical protein
MQHIQIRPIENAIRIQFDGSQVSLPSDLVKEASDYWTQRTQENPHLSNGAVFTVTSVEDTSEGMEVKLAQTDYVHYLYSLHIGNLGIHTVRIIHPATLVTTSDDKLVFGSMGSHTSRPGIIQCCGGGIDPDDIKDGQVDIGHNVAKELKEELGIDPSDKHTVDAFGPALLKTGGPTGKMTVIYTLLSKQTNTSFLQSYKAFTKELKAKGKEPEFGRIYCLPATSRAVEAFIQKHENSLNEYMPALLRHVVRVP